jgi:hypothetical protein
VKVLNFAMHVQTRGSFSPFDNCADTDLQGVLIIERIHSAAPLLPQQQIVVMENFETVKNKM